MTAVVVIEVFVNPVRETGILDIVLSRLYDLWHREYILQPYCDLLYSPLVSVFATFHSSGIVLVMIFYVTVGFSIVALLGEGYERLYYEVSQ